MFEPIVIYSQESMIRCFGEVNGRKITLVSSLKSLEGDNRYRVERLSKKVVFMGWLSKDRTYIIQD